MVLKKVHFDVRSLTPDFYAPVVDGITAVAAVGKVIRESSYLISRPTLYFSNFM